MNQIINNLTVIKNKFIEKIQHSEAVSQLDKVKSDFKRVIKVLHKIIFN